MAAYPPVGPWADRLNEVRLKAPPTLEIKTVVRPWDRDLWPRANGGFFKFRQAIPDYC